MLVWGLDFTFTASATATHHPLGSHSRSGQLTPSRDSGTMSPGTCHLSGRPSPCRLPSASSLLWLPACRWGATLQSLQGSKGTEFQPHTRSWGPHTPARGQPGPPAMSLPPPAVPQERAGQWGLCVCDKEGNWDSKLRIWGGPTSSCWLNRRDTELGASQHLHPLGWNEQKLGFAQVCRETKSSQLSGREDFVEINNFCSAQEEPRVWGAVER